MAKLNILQESCIRDSPSRKTVEYLKTLPYSKLVSLLSPYLAQGIEYITFQQLQEIQRIIDSEKEVLKTTIRARRRGPSAASLVEAEGYGEVVDLDNDIVELLYRVSEQITPSQSPRDSETAAIHFFKSISNLDGVSLSNSNVKDIAVREFSRKKRIGTRTRKGLRILTKLRLKLKSKELQKLIEKETVLEELPELFEGVDLDNPTEEDVRRITQEINARAIDRTKPEDKAAVDQAAEIRIQ